MARTTTNKVEFAQAVRSIRPPREDELSVMKHFAQHAARCSRCADPYTTYKNSGELCERGHSLARDVARYIYSKGGRPFSVIDKDYHGERTEVEVPVDCEAVRGLIKAIDRGMSLRARTVKKTPVVISQDRNYYIPERPKPREEKHYYDPEDRANVIEVTPGRGARKERERYNTTTTTSTKDREARDRRRQTVYVETGRGSLYRKDEEAKQARKRYDEEPVIIYAEPGRRFHR